MSPTSPPVVSHDPNISQIPGLELISMAEFDAEMLARQAEEDKQRRLSSQRPAAKKQKVQLSSLPMAPILISSGTKTSEWVPKLNHLAQTRTVVTNYTFNEPAPYSFSAELVILDKGVELAKFNTGKTFFRNKKEAKDAVAEQGFKYLSTHLPVPSPDPVPTAKTATSPKADENWIGLLNHFCQTASKPLPTFAIYQGGSNAMFSATCSITVPGSNEIVFGDETSYCTTKKAAKAQAARDAVIYLRTKDLLPMDALASGIHTSADVSRKGSDNLYKPDQNSSGPSLLAQSPVPAMLQILALCKTLAVVGPSFTYTPDPLSATFVSAAAFFPGEADLQGPIGAVERVFGRKKAKDECAKRVLVALEELRDRRLEAAQETET